MSFTVDTSSPPGDVWDEFVSSRPAGNLMQSRGWGEFMKSRGWTPRYGLLRDGGDILSSALILARRVPGLGDVFYCPRGPVADFEDRTAAETLFREVCAYVDQAGGVFMRCDPYWPETEVLNGGAPPACLTRVPRDWSNWNLPRLVLWLDLSGDEETVLMRMTSRCRNDVRRGYKNGVEFYIGDASDLEDFHRLMVETAKHKGIPVHGIDYYRDLMDVVNRSAAVRLFIGRYEGDAVCGGMSAVYGEKAWLLYAASSPSSYDLRANRTLQWEMIKWAHSKGCHRYDFRGTATSDPPSPDDPGYGVYQFKKSFGPEFTRLTGYYDLVSRPLTYRAMRLAEEHALPIAYRLRTWLKR